MKERLQSITNKLPSLFAILLILIIWHVLSITETVPSYMLPAPLVVVNALFSDFGSMAYHMQVTLTEGFVGLLIGIVLGSLVATLMDYFKILKQAIYPIMIITQTIPTVALAPILVLWMGFGMEPKITLVVITTFFPIAVGVYDGLTSVDKEAVKLFKSMNATNWQIFRHLKLPMALPQFFSALKISSSYAVVGAVIAEWLGGFEGLGVYMTRVRKAYAFPQMYAVIILIVIISLLLMFIVGRIGILSMPWLYKKAAPVRHRDENKAR